MYFLLGKVDFHCHVSLPEGKYTTIYCLFGMVSEIEGRLKHGQGSKPLQNGPGSWRMGSQDGLVGPLGSPPKPWSHELVIWKGSQ